MTNSSRYDLKTSYGIILFHYNANIKEIKYLLVRRKDSIEYVNFVRGRYLISNVEKRS